EGFQLGEVLAVLLEQSGQAQQDRAAVARLHPTPVPGLEGGAGGGDRPVHVAGVAGGDVGEVLAGGGVQGGEGLAAERGDELAADIGVGAEGGGQGGGHVGPSGRGGAVAVGRGRWL